MVAKKDYKEVFRGYFNEAVEELVVKFSPKTATEAAQFAMILAGIELQDKKHEPERQNKMDVDAKQNSSDTESAQYADLVCEELGDADKYYAMAEYGIANEELGHAAYFLEKARKLAHARNDQAVIRDLEARYSLMAQAINAKIST